MDGIAGSPGKQLATVVRDQADEYSRSSKAALSKLMSVWHDLEVPHEEQVRELQDITARAHRVWDQSVQEGEAQRQQLRRQVQELLAEIASTKEQLGDDLIRQGIEAELASLQADKSGHKTLKAWYADVCEKAEYWSARKTQRLAEYEDLMARIRTARQQIGQAQPPPAAMPDISAAAMEYLKLELEKLQAERARREARMEALLDSLKAVCAELGEDDKFMAAEVHPSLIYMWDKESHKVLRDVYRLAGCSLGGDGGSSGGPLQVDLGDGTFRAMQRKLDDIASLKAQREAHASELMGVLNSLWDAVEVPIDSPERAVFVKTMTGSVRLHIRSLEKCMSEVRRLEEAKVQQMLEIVNAKARELLELCASSHIAPPDNLRACITAINSDGRGPGAAADLLAKLMHMLAEVRVVAAKREGLIGLVGELEEARKEEGWLREYEGDEQRYKGRDANRKLQRAIKAGKVRERLPAMVADVRAALAEWLDAESEPFLYDGRDYEAEVLERLSAELEGMQLEKTSKTAARRSNSANTPSGQQSAAAPALPVVGRPGTATGNRTPMPKGLSQQQALRHSMSVIRSKSETLSGPQMMSRSGEVQLPRPQRSFSAAGSSAANMHTPPPMQQGGRLTSSMGVGSGASPFVGGQEARAAAGTPTPASNRLNKILQNVPMHAVATLPDSRAAPVTPPADIYSALHTDTAASDQDTAAPKTGSSFASAQSNSVGPSMGGSGAGGSYSGKGAVSGAGGKSVGGRKQQTPGSAARLSRIPQPQF